MAKMMYVIVAFLIALSLPMASMMALANVGGADARTELRYCTKAPSRASDNTIARSSSIITAFRKIHPCPSSGKVTGACPGWSIDHTIPLECGGCDAVSNMQWLPNQIKSASGIYPKDRWEKRVYCTASLP
jgi:hypothetical protein